MTSPLQYSCLAGQRSLAGYSPWGRKEVEKMSDSAHFLSPPLQMVKFYKYSLPHGGVHFLCVQTLIDNVQAQGLHTDECLIELNSLSYCDQGQAPRNLLISKVWKKQRKGTRDRRQSVDPTSVATTAGPPFSSLSCLFKIRNRHSPSC